MDTLKDYIKSKYFKDPAPLHDFYREWFNLIDLINRYWYEVSDKHKNGKWKSKMLFSILRFFLINVWVFSSKEKFNFWKNFREELAKEMIKFELEINSNNY